jgi:hypothetical protein
MRAFIRIAGLDAAPDELELHGPLTGCIGVVADHLGGRARATFDRIATLDRDRARGEHAFDCEELLHLIATAHALLVEPPRAVRRHRRVPTGPLPSAERIGLVVVWLRSRRDRAEQVAYDLWGVARAEPS